MDDSDADNAPAFIGRRSNSYKNLRFSSQLAQI